MVDGFPIYIVYLVLPISLFIYLFIIFCILLTLNVQLQNVWKPYSVLDETLAPKASLDKCKSFSCFRHGNRKRVGINISIPGAFVDKSTFHLSKQAHDNGFVSKIIPDTSSLSRAHSI